MSLLHYLVQQFHKHQPELLNLPSKMQAVGKASESELVVIACQKIDSQLGEILRYSL